jgi:hypothetical protein
MYEVKQHAGSLGPSSRVIAEDLPRELPDVTFDRAVIKANGIYEINGKDKKGKVRDVEMTAAGEVTEVE